MTFKLFNRTLAFDFRNGCGIDLEFHEGKAVWVSHSVDGDDVEVAVFVGVILLLPFFSTAFGKCYIQNEEF